MRAAAMVVAGAVICLQLHHWQPVCPETPEQTCSITVQR